MKDEYSELNDIILNRHDQSGTRKKMLIGIGTLAIVAIVIVIIMGRLSGSAPTQLPQPMLPSEQPKTVTETPETAVPAPAAPQVEAQLDAVAEKVKSADETRPVPLAESEIVVIDETTAPAPSEPVKTAQPSKTPAAAVPAPAKEVVQAPAPAAKAAVRAGTVYIQVGSFSRYQPNDAFLGAIKRHGYDYTFHRVVVNGKISNKVLVGPFKDRADAVAHLSDVRRKIESGAFIYTVKP